MCVRVCAGVFVLFKCSWNGNLGDEQMNEQVSNAYLLLLGPLPVCFEWNERMPAFLLAHSLTRHPASTSK